MVSNPNPISDRLRSMYILAAWVELNFGRQPIVAAASGRCFQEVFLSCGISAKWSGIINYARIPGPLQEIPECCYRVNTNRNQCLMQVRTGENSYQKAP